MSTTNSTTNGPAAEPTVVASAKALNQKLQHLILMVREMVAESTPKEPLADFLNRIRDQSEGSSQLEPKNVKEEDIGVQVGSSVSNINLDGAADDAGPIKGGVQPQKPAEPIERILMRAREEGYQRGWDNGRALGHRLGFGEGKKVGRTQGLREVRRRGNASAKPMAMAKAQNIGGTSKDGHAVENGQMPKGGA